MNTIVQNVIDVVKGRKAFPRIYGVERSGDGIAFIPPKPFTDLYEEREHRKKQLAAAFRLLARNGT